MECPHCKFLYERFTDIDNAREYWLFTEMFVYLHDSKDYCNFTENMSKDNRYDQT